LTSAQQILSGKNKGPPERDILLATPHSYLWVTWFIQDNYCHSLGLCQWVTIIILKKQGPSQTGKHHEHTRRGEKDTQIVSQGALSKRLRTNNCYRRWSILLRFETQRRVYVLTCTGLFH
jgi:hypothetical protein